MPDHPDYAALIAGHTALIEMINSGESGLHVLTRVLGLAQQSIQADGMIFVEYAPGRGRIVAATGIVEWAVGRPVPGTEPLVNRVLTGPRDQELRMDSMTGELADHLGGHGVGRMLVARAEIGGVAVGSLHAVFRADERADPEHQAVLAYLAASIAHMYGDQAGLPVHGDGPVVAALADGLAIVDRGGGVRLWNRAAEQVIGRSAADAINRPLPFPMPPPGQVADHRLPDGRWIQITSGELSGSVTSRVVTFRDVTDQHRRDHDRDLFVAVTSHELRTPVTVIKGYAETLSKHWDSLSEPERRKAADVIGQRAGELARLVDRLLCSSAAGTGPLGDSPPVPFDLVEALRDAAADLPADLRRRLTMELAAGLPKALGDRASLSTVLTELVTNAGKYSPEGSPILLTTDTDPQNVAFRVIDQGIGIRPEHVERAFERFWQGESGDRRRFPGAGLGLYLVRRIVERQKGWVSLRPHERGGTVAEVRLPRG